MFSFDLQATDGKARLGRLHTAHGVIDTPAFMPVGTAATVKGMTTDQVEASGAQIVLANTYHLMLRPGAERIKRLGGLHRFMHWDKPILTDSGGFQVMSLTDLCTLSEEGVVFRSHIDGSKHQLTPEYATQIQHALGSTITMVLDECTPYPATHTQAADSMQRSMRWAARSKEAFVQRPGYGMFGIVQGGVYPDLRHASVEQLLALDFDGMAIGGLAVGEGHEVMLQTLEHTVPHIPALKPRYLMGVGKPLDIIEAVMRGVDMFDCVLPTRSGRNAQAFTSQGTLHLRNAQYAEDPEPLDPACACPTCQHYSRAYLHHLFKAKEMLGPMLLTQHNIYYYQKLMQQIRAAIAAGALGALAEEMRRIYG